VDLTLLGTVEGVEPVAIHADTQRVAVSISGRLGLNSEVRAYSAGNLASFTKFGGRVGHRLAFSSNGNHVVVTETHVGDAINGNWRFRGYVCNVTNGALVRFRGDMNWSPGPQGSVLVCFSPSGALFALSGGGIVPKAYIVDLGSVGPGMPRSDKDSTRFAVLLKLEPSDIESIVALNWSPNGEYLAQVAYTGRSFWLTLWGIANCETKAVSASHYSSVPLDETVQKGSSSPSRSTAFTPDSTLLVIGGSRWVPIRLVDVAARKIVCLVPYEGAAMTALAFTPGGKYLVSGDGDGWLRRWELATSASGPSLSLVDSAQLPGSILHLSVSSDGSSAFVISRRDKGLVDIGRFSLPDDPATSDQTNTTDSVIQTQPHPAPPDEAPTAAAEAAAVPAVPTPASAPAPAPWTATHRAPAAGILAWTLPDGRLAPTSQLPGNLDLEVVARAGVWVQVRDANGWLGWVDGRLLVDRG